MLWLVLQPWDCYYTQLHPLALKSLGFEVRRVVQGLGASGKPQRPGSKLLWMFLWYKKGTKCCVAGEVFGIPGEALKEVLKLMPSQM